MGRPLHGLKSHTTHQTHRRAELTELASTQISQPSTHPTTPPLSSAAGTPGDLLQGIDHTQLSLRQATHAIEATYYRLLAFHNSIRRNLHRPSGDTTASDMNNEDFPGMGPNHTALVLSSEAPEASSNAVQRRDVATPPIPSRSIGNPPRESRNSQLDTSLDTIPTVSRVERFRYDSSLGRLSRVQDSIRPFSMADYYIAPEASGSSTPVSVLPRTPGGRDARGDQETEHSPSVDDTVAQLTQRRGEILEELYDTRNTPRDSGFTSTPLGFQRSAPLDNPRHSAHALYRWVVSQHRPVSSPTAADVRVEDTPRTSSTSATGGTTSRAAVDYTPRERFGPRDTGRSFTADLRPRSTDNDPSWVSERIGSSRNSLDLGALQEADDLDLQLRQAMRARDANDESLRSIIEQILQRQRIQLEAPERSNHSTPLSVPTLSSRVRRRGWVRLDQNGNEITTDDEEEYERSRAHMRLRAQNLTAAYRARERERERHNARPETLASASPAAGPDPSSPPATHTRVSSLGTSWVLPYLSSSSTRRPGTQTWGSGGARRNAQETSSAGTPAAWEGDPADCDERPLTPNIDFIDHFDETEETPLTGPIFQPSTLPLPLVRLDGCETPGQEPRKKRVVRVSKGPFAGR